MKKQTNQKLVTEELFRSEINRLDGKIDGVEKRLNGKIDNIALKQIKMEDDFLSMKNNMATKQDVQIILNHIDASIGKSRAIDQEQGIQAIHLREVRETVEDHEKRISILEAKRANLR